MSQPTASSSSSTRREFLGRSGRWMRDGMLLGIGVGLGSQWGPLATFWGAASAVAQSGDVAEGPEARLKKLGIVLPAPPKPVAVYIPAVRVGNMVYASGHGPNREDGTSIQGKVGKDLTLEQGYDAARLVGINLLSSVRNTLGSLDKVVRLVKVLGLVNCTPEFAQQPKVVNGFSELMVQVFGEQAGKGARSAVGTSALPNNIAVEVEAIFEVRG